MSSLFLCVGSACYHHGAPEILKIIQTKIEEHHLETEVELMGHFCLGTCGHAVLMRYKNYYFDNLTPKNAADVFETKILPTLLME